MRGTLRGYRVRGEQRGDHPRVCGEHLEAIMKAYDADGSSPRMRGTHVSRNYAYLTDGIIPAYAGNTSAQAHT